MGLLYSRRGEQWTALQVSKDRWGCCWWWNRVCRSQQTCLLYHALIWSEYMFLRPGYREQSMRTGVNEGFFFFDEVWVIASKDSRAIDNRLESYQTQSKRRVSVDSLWFAHMCAQPCSPLFYLMNCGPPGSSVHGLPGKNADVGSCFLLQGIFLAQGSNLHLLSPALQADSLPTEPPGIPNFWFASVSIL